MQKKIDVTLSDKLDSAIAVAKNRLPSLLATADIQKLGQSVLNLRMAKALYVGIANATEELDEEVGFVLGKVRANLTATDMQQITQAVLHLMQAKAQCEELQPQQHGTKTVKKLGVGA